jgi:hypothetical protein
VSTEVFAQPPTGRSAVGCTAVFLALPTIGATISLYRDVAPIYAVLPLPIALMILALAYYIGSRETRVTIDERSLRFSRTRVMFGIRASERIEWELPIEKLTEAHETITRTPARNGGWNVDTRLALRDGRTLLAHDLGGADSSDTAYSRMRNALRARLGEAFHTRTIT